MDQMTSAQTSTIMMRGMPLVMQYGMSALQEFADRAAIVLGNNLKPFLTQTMAYMRDCEFFGDIFG